MGIIKRRKYDRRKSSKSRSSRQNSLYWKWVTIIGDNAGYTKDEMHNQIKRDYLINILIRDDSDFAELWVNLTKIDDNILTNGVVDLISTARLTTKQFAEYLTDIERSTPYPLPHPDDGYWEAMGIKRG